MFFVDHEESEVFEYYAFRENSMGCHHAIKGSICESFQNLSRFFCGTKSSQNSESNSKVSESFSERLHMLICEHHKWRDEDRLFTIEESTVDGVHCDFCFSKSYIPREESIHRITRLHICEDFRNRRFLIESVFIRKI